MGLRLEGSGITSEPRYVCEFGYFENSEPMQVKKGLGLLTGMKWS